MSCDAVEALERELGYTAEDRGVLQGVRLVWQRLEKLRQQATRDGKFVRQYRDLLHKSIAQARAQQPVADPEVQSQEFWTWYDEQCRLLGVAEKERARGRPHQEWCERWLAEDYRRFYIGIAKVVEEPTPQHFEQLRTTAVKMLTAYIKAI